MNLRHPQHSVMCDSRTKTWAGYWPLIEQQTFSIDLCSPILNTFGKQVVAILSLMLHPLYIRLISVAWFICAPALSMKCEATEWNKLLIRFTFEFVLFYTGHNLDVKLRQRQPRLCKHHRQMYKIRCSNTTKDSLTLKNIQMIQQLFRHLHMSNAADGTKEHRVVHCSIEGSLNYYLRLLLQQWSQAMNPHYIF